MNPGAITKLLEAVHSREVVNGLTHGFYRYPARFSPLFARAAIQAFSQPGDVILDPFMGGGTTLVEARVLGRRAIGVDINALAVFVTKVKTSLLSEREIAEVKLWIEDIADNLRLHQSFNQRNSSTELDYPPNLNDKTTWRIRKILKLALDQMNELSGRQQDFARCALLKTAQWALDCRTEIPNTQQFRQQLLGNLAEMASGAREYAKAVRKAEQSYDLRGSAKVLCLHRSAIGLEEEPRLKNRPAPKLILTSPPYPGVHVLYHRWQIQGRRETSAPFWIADRLDGSGASFYTFGDRKQEGLTTYYEHTLAAFTSLAKLADKRTLILQMVAFSDPSWQLSRYLSTMEQAGFKEIKKPALSNSPDGRLWRIVPNRKWYANQERAKATSKEAVLFHQLG